jgi:hypothetical protein
MAPEWMIMSALRSSGMVSTFSIAHTRVLYPFRARLETRTLAGAKSWERRASSRAGHAQGGLVAAISSVSHSLPKVMLLPSATTCTACCARSLSRKASRRDHRRAGNARALASALMSDGQPLSDQRASAAPMRTAL